MLIYSYLPWTFLFSIYYHAKTREQWRDLAVFESSCHLLICRPRTLEASHCPLLILNAKEESCEYQKSLDCLVWLDWGTAIVLKSSRRLIHSTTNRFLNHSSKIRSMPIKWHKVIFLRLCHWILFSVESCDVIKSWSCSLNYYYHLI